jgi:hypothetical protein
MVVVDSETLGAEQPACRIAVRHFEDAERDLNVYAAMLWAFSALLLAFLILAIALFVAGKDTSALVGLVGTVGSGAGAGFVVKRQREARKASKDAMLDVQKLCTEPVKQQLSAA